MVAARSCFYAWLSLQIIGSTVNDLFRSFLAIMAYPPSGCLATSAMSAASLSPRNLWIRAGLSSDASCLWFSQPGPQNGLFWKVTGWRLVTKASKTILSILIRSYPLFVCQKDTLLESTNCSTIRSLKLKWVARLVHELTKTDCCCKWTWTSTGKAEQDRGKLVRLGVSIQCRYRKIDGQYTIQYIRINTYLYNHIYQKTKHAIVDG